MNADLSGKFYQSMREDSKDNKGVNVYNGILLAVSYCSNFTCKKRNAWEICQPGNSFIFYDTNWSTGGLIPRKPLNWVKWTRVVT